MARVVPREELEPRRPEPKERPLLDLNALATALADAVRSINIPAPQVQVEAPATAQPSVEVNVPEPIRQWVFSITRDKDGFISEIIARAK